MVVSVSTCSAEDPKTAAPIIATLLDLWNSDPTKGGNPRFIPVFFPKQFTVGVLNATLDLAALVLVGVVGFLVSEVVLSPVVSGCLPSCRGWVLVGVAVSRTNTFRNQNHRFQYKFAYCKLFGVYAGVIKWFEHQPNDQPLSHYHDLSLDPFIG